MTARLTNMTGQGHTVLVRIGGTDVYRTIPAGGSLDVDSYGPHVATLAAGKRLKITQTPAKPPAPVEQASVKPAKSRVRAEETN